MGSIVAARTIAVLLLVGALVQGCASPTSSGVGSKPGARPAAAERVAVVDPDPALSAYVRGIGGRLVTAAGLNAGEWHFGVLDAPEPNAVSMTGRRILVSRGMLALANDEAELATVLAHEIGHVVSGDPGSAHDGGARRAAEFRADRLGMGYLAAAGYDTRAQADLLVTLIASNGLAGGVGSVEHSRESGHPAIADRLAAAELGAADAPAGSRERSAYLDAIDGLVWGDGPSQGFVDGRTFVHPLLRFAFDPPGGYTLFNGQGAIVANGPDGAAFLFDSLPDPGGSPADYLVRGWAPEIGRDVSASAVRGLRTRRLNGLEAAQGELTLRTERSSRVADLTVVRYRGEFYRLIGLHRAEDESATSVLRASAESFRAISADEAWSAEPLRLRVHRIAPGENIAALVEAMPVASPPETFALLNGLKPGQSLRVGDRVKLIGE